MSFLGGTGKITEKGSAVWRKALPDVIRKGEFAVLNFAYYLPTIVLFGKHEENGVADQIRAFGGSRVLIVYGGGSVLRSGLIQRVRQLLDAAGIAHEELGGVHPNPWVSLAREGVRRALAFRADFLLAVGGGSVIDTAKAVAHGAKNPKLDLWDDIWSKRVPITQSLPVGVILTIPAAGSETSNSAVLTNEETGDKIGLTSELNRPRFAIMNPELAYTLPKFQLACGIVDIMMHTLDRYFSADSHTCLTDELAEGLLRTAVKNGEIAYRNQTDYDAMSELMWCGSLSHNGLTGLGRLPDFVPHKLSHPLSGRFDVTHGAALSAVWGSWARYVLPENPRRFRQYAEKVWGIHEKDPERTAKEGILRTESFFRSLGMPVCLGELKTGVLPDTVLREMAKSATKNDTLQLGSFKIIRQRDAYAIYVLANHNGEKAEFI